MSIQDIINQTIEDDEIGYNGVADEIYAVVTYANGNSERWDDVSLINHLQEVDRLASPADEPYHQLSELIAAGIVDVEIHFVHKVFGFGTEEFNAV